uniref:Trihelix transcription factor ASR3-like n=1 Tax=Nelumbo nucifera TaxID=4432 RepID=A0A822YCU3_NELNU|nr:TPA_asm: hypothetical protein HUJ06_009261 [Nelumbo nucifera]
MLRTLKRRKGWRRRTRRYSIAVVARRRKKGCFPILSNRGRKRLAVAQRKRRRRGVLQRLCLLRCLFLDAEKQYHPFSKGHLDQGTSEKQPTANPEKESTSQEGRKRRRLPSDGGHDTSLQDQLIEVLERNSRMLTAQLEVQNMNCQLDRDQRKDHADSLVAVLSKLADALGRIADRL